jgi:A/G-specific adenine glycosylase
MDARKFASFQELVWDFYRQYGRHDLPWRAAEADGRFDPYKILVSEVMLQQTQVPRVIPKYYEFLAKFPDVRTLAAAPLGEVLSTWNGLGYNRRAKFLWQAAQKVMDDFGGEFPATRGQLETLPGVGPNTAGAILAYAFNQPVAFVETNIRTVFIHHFFKDQAEISDKEILILVEKTLDNARPREWYWSLMDYGSHLKQTVGNLSTASKSYAKQSRFDGSRRQLRGRIIRQLVGGPANRETLAIADERLDGVLAELAAEGLIQKTGTLYSLFA